MQLYLDMDGVLADFDSHYEDRFGYRPDKATDNADWNIVRMVKDFYLHIPPMRDAWLLWKYVERYQPIILTGIPSSVPEAADNKRAWVRKHYGDKVKVECCRSKEKCSFASPGDVLVDDWEKYKDLWLAKGGRWITHESAPLTIQALQDIGL